MKSGRGNDARRDSPDMSIKHSQRRGAGVIKKLTSPFARSSVRSSSSTDSFSSSTEWAEAAAASAASLSCYGFEEVEGASCSGLCYNQVHFDRGGCSALHCAVVKTRASVNKDFTLRIYVP